MASSIDLGPVETVTMNAMASGPRTVVALGSSPCTLMNKCATRIEVSISLGTVTTIAISNDQGINYDDIGLLGGQWTLNPSDSIRITYILAPTVVFSPM